MSDTKQPKYYLGFIAEKFNVDKFHCTHLYLGELSDTHLLSLGSIVNDYFKFYGVPTMAPVSFNTEAMFGEDKNIRVLLADPQDANAFKVFRILRNVIKGAGYGGVNVTKFQDFNPHMTTDMKALRIQFTHYALIADKQVMCAWPINGTWDKKQ